MIKLSKGVAPAYLTEEKIAELIQRFKATKDSVWRHTAIVTPLFESSHKKCAFCECELEVRGAYMEVEHFAHKDQYPDDVVSWDNLIAACKSCNTAKGVHDVRTEPIINPYIVDPRQHLYLEAYKFRGRTEIGTLTIETINLNELERAVKKRFEVSNQIDNAVEDLMLKVEKYKEEKSARRRNRLTNAVKGILIECGPIAPYAGTVSTALLRNPDFPPVIQFLKEEGLWTIEIESDYQSCLSIFYRDRAPQLAH